MQRRHALSLVASLGSGLLLGPTRLWAAPPSGARLLVVFLRGAYDACNLLVPTGSNFYYETRREIAIARPSTDPASALPLDDGWGLHPALRETIYPLYQNGQATFIPFAGTHDLSRSHFETQDSIEQGCIRRGTDKNDPADAVQKRCACASSVLRTRLTVQEWKTAVAAAFNGDRATATNIIAKHKDEMTVCNPG